MDEWTSVLMLRMNTLLNILLYVGTIYYRSQTFTINVNERNVRVWGLVLIRIEKWQLVTQFLGSLQNREGDLYLGEYVV